MTTKHTHSAVCGFCGAKVRLYTLTPEQAQQEGYEVTALDTEQVVRGSCDKCLAPKIVTWADDDSIKPRRR